ncbi:MAG: FMN-binding glutamate synthase family protein [Bdellovibrionaceae bacterium]|nr:FMN-binding glutamate synthase family protein [Pseudobdellovibrionaceae bacterium]
MKFKIERLAVVINFLIPVAFLLSWYFFSFYSISTLCLFILLLFNFYCRHIQKTHTLLANFGILSFLRYFLEGIGPELRQYLYSSDIEEKPFNRMERRDVYIKAKNEGESSAFGSLLDFRNRAYTLKHSLYPIEKKNLQRFSLCFGEERALNKSYTISHPLLIGGMSYGALGKHAVRALSRGAKKTNLIINTGEGGYPKYHLMEACDLIFQIGTGKFGVRKENGDFDPDKLSSLSQKKEVKMIEIKFSQGAKPGKGGFLPKEKITEEIAKLRNIPLGKDLYSPPCHKECSTPLKTVRFIQQIQEISQLPVGIKFCLGREKEIYELFSIMKKEKSFPDYIAIDGSEGGTGAAPKTFMDDLGYDLKSSLKIIDNIIKDMGINNNFKRICSGKLISSGKQLMAMALGSDAVSTARGFLLALGCIQALRCHTNNCPTGITTHKTKLMKGLDIEKKSERVKNYALHILDYNYEILGALGLKAFSELKPEHVM